MKHGVPILEGIFTWHLQCSSFLIGCSWLFMVFRGLGCHIDVSVLLAAMLLRSHRHRCVDVLLCVGVVAWWCSLFSNTLDLQGGCWLTNISHSFCEIRSKEKCKTCFCTVDMDFKVEVAGGEGAPSSQYVSLKAS